MINNKRLGYIDLLKGYGIFLVVMGHATTPRSPYIYSFHVPLFFFISGYLYVNKPFREFFLSKLKSIYFTFVIFNVFTWIFFYFLGLMKHVPADVNSYKNLYRVIIGFENSVPQNGPMWFLLCLFTVSIIYRIIYTLRNEYIKLAVVLSLTVSGYFLSQNFTDLPFKFETALIMILFFYLGNMFSILKIPDKFDKLPMIYVFNAVIVLSYIHYILNNINLNITDIDRISVLQNRYGNIFLFYLTALSAILYTSLIAKKIDSVSIMNYLGKNSLIILCVHYPILQYVERSSPVFVSGSFFFDLISGIITLVLCLPIIYLVSKIKHIPALRKI